MLDTDTHKIETPGLASLIACVVLHEEVSKSITDYEHGNGIVTPICDGDIVCDPVSCANAGTTGTNALTLALSVHPIPGGRKWLGPGDSN